MIVPGIYVYSIFLVSVCIVCFLCRVLCYSDCSLREAIWFNPFATVLFNVSSAVTVECCVLYSCCVGVFGMFSVM